LPRRKSDWSFCKSHNIGEVTSSQHKKAMSCDEPPPKSLQLKDNNPGQLENAKNKKMADLVQNIDLAKATPTDKEEKKGNTVVPATVTSAMPERLLDSKDQVATSEQMEETKPAAIKREKKEEEDAEIENKGKGKENSRMEVDHIKKDIDDGFTTPPCSVWSTTDTAYIKGFQSVTNIQTSPIAADKKGSSSMSYAKGRAQQPKLVWTGTAVGDRINTEGTEDWPDKWVKKVFKRRKGESKGRLDSYWYSPKNGLKFRSLQEIERYMKVAKETDNDEELAWLLMKRGKEKH
jgi:Methyl-CpG binding domain